MLAGNIGGKWKKYVGGKWNFYDDPNREAIRWKVLVIQNSCLKKHAKCIVANYNKMLKWPKIEK